MLRDAVDAAANDAAVRAIVLTGHGRVFCAGQDLGEHAAALDADATDRVRDDRRALQPDRRRPRRRTQAGPGRDQRHLRRCRPVARTRRRHPAVRRHRQVHDRVHGDRPQLRLRPVRRRSRGPSGRHGRASSCCSPSRSPPSRRSSGASSAASSRPTTSRSKRPRVAARLAAGPTLAYAAAKQAIHDAWAKPLADVLAAEGNAQRRLGLTADHRARRRRVPRQRTTDLRRRVMDAVPADDGAPTGSRPAGASSSSSTVKVAPSPACWSRPTCSTATTSPTVACCSHSRTPRSRAHATAWRRHRSPPPPRSCS